jgi:hypothetical protein
MPRRFLFGLICVGRLRRQKFEDETISESNNPRLLVIPAYAGMTKF